MPPTWSIFIVEISFKIHEKSSIPRFLMNFERNFYDKYWPSWWHQNFLLYFTPLKVKLNLYADYGSECLWHQDIFIVELSFKNHSKTNQSVSKKAIDRSKINRTVLKRAIDRFLNEISTIYVWFRKIKQLTALNCII